MTSAEIYLIAGLIAGFAFVFGRDRWRARRQLERAERRGLEPGHDGLGDLPSSLSESVLFTVGDGGHERSVVVGQVALDRDAEPVPMTIFDLALQRDVRGEWAFLDSEPRFRIFSPLTVIAFTLPAPRVPHLLLKRRGQAEKIAEEGWERYKSAADLVRDLSSIERAIPVDPPGALPRKTMAPTVPMPEYLVWAADATHADALLSAELVEFLSTPRVTSHELVIEVLDSLLLMYCARDGALGRDAVDAFADTAQTVARLIVRALPRD